MSSPQNPTWLNRLRSRPKQNGWNLTQERSDGFGEDFMTLNGTEYSCEPMNQSLIAELEKQMRVVLFMIDVTLSSTHSIGRYDTYCSLFQSLRYEDSVIFLLKKIRQFVSTFIERQDVVLLARGQEIRVMAIKGLSQSTLTNVMAEALCSPPTIALHPSFWCKSPQLEDFHTIRLDREAFRNNSSTRHRAAILFHELVHLVSGLHFREFLAASKANLSGRWTKKRLVIDMTFDKVIIDSNPNDMAILSQVSGDTRAYGMDYCPKLAQCSYGAEGSLLNADSYTMLVSVTACQYLQSRLRPWEDMGLRAAQDELICLMHEYEPELQQLRRSMPGERDQRKARSLSERYWSAAAEPLSRILSAQSLEIFKEKARQVRAVLEAPIRAVNVHLIRKWWNRTDYEVSSHRQWFRMVNRMFGWELVDSLH